MKKSLRLKLIVYILSPVIVIYLVVSVSNLWHIKSTTIENTQLKLVGEAFIAANLLEAELLKIEKLAFKMQSEIATNKDLNADEIYTFLENSIKSNHLIDGASLAFDSSVIDNGKKLYSPYVSKINDSIRKVNIGDHYNYLLPGNNWFNKPKKDKVPCWSEPYKAEVAGIMFSSYSFPIFKNKKLWAVLVLDISLVDIIKNLKLKKPNDFNYFIITNEERFIYSHQVADIGKKIWESNYFKDSEVAIKQNIKEIIQGDGIGQSGYSAGIENTDYWVYYSPVKTSNWKVAISISKYTALKVYRWELIQAIAFLLVIALVLIAIILRIARKISQPINELTLISEKITSGEKHVTLEVRSEDEIGRLANSFQVMTANLLEKETQLKKSNRSLDIANKELQGFDFARNNFLKIIGHEIRTPLNGIIGIVDLLDRDIGKESEFCEFMQMLKLSVDRLDSFSKTALIITELQTESFKLSTELICIDQLVSACLLQHQLKIEERSLKMVKEQYNSSIKVQLNKYYMDHAMSAVLSNAIKYSPEKGVISLHLVEKEKNVILEIIDQGEGFNDRSLNYLFESFGMGEDHYDENTGLSLKAAKTIMNAHNGDILVENLELGGAKVSFIFAKEINRP